MDEQGENDPSLFVDPLLSTLLVVSGKTEKEEVFRDRELFLPLRDKVFEESRGLYYKAQAFQVG